MVLAHAQHIFRRKRYCARPLSLDLKAIEPAQDLYSRAPVMPETFNKLYGFDRVIDLVLSFICRANAYACAVRYV
jgi:hypothetical protein